MIDLTIEDDIGQENRTTFTGTTMPLEQADSSLIMLRRFDDSSTYSDYSTVTDLQESGLVIAGAPRDE